MVFIKAGKHKKSILVVFLYIILMLFAGFYTVNAEEEPACITGNHVDVETGRVPETEEQDGMIFYRCEICGREYGYVIPSSGHGWGEWMVEKKPTCGAPGYRRRTCILHGGHSEIEEIPAAGHSYIETVTPPNCTSHGERQQVCENCGKQTAEPFGEPAGHIYEEKIIKQAGCTEAGVKEFTCTSCKESYTEEIMGTGHRYGAWEIQTPSSATEEGVRVLECINGCGHAISEQIPILSLEAEETAPVEEVEVAEKPKIEVMDIAVTSLNAGLLVFFWGITHVDVYVLFWVKKRQSAIAAEEVELLGGLFDDFV